MRTLNSNVAKRIYCHNCFYIIAKNSQIDAKSRFTFVFNTGHTIDNNIYIFNHIFSFNK